MSSQFDFLLNQAEGYIKGGNFDSAILLLKQILRVKPDHAYVLRMMAVAHAQQGLNREALDFVDKAITANRKDGIAYSNRGNILQNLGRNTEAVDAYLRAIQLNPDYAEAYGNLANTQQILLDYEGALKNHLESISRDSINPNFYCNLGNFFAEIGRDEEACDAYKKAIELQPNHADAHYFLGHLKLRKFDFSAGWAGNEWRWKSKNFKSTYINTSIKTWDGKALSGSLYIWAEQGIGDQILYASMLNEVRVLVGSLTVSVESKLIPVFQRSFPKCHFIDKAQFESEGSYESQIPIGSIGQFFRKKFEDFNGLNKYLLPDATLAKKIRLDSFSSKKVICGISWKSSNPFVGLKKSISLREFAPIFKLKADISFVNLQYGDTRLEVSDVKNAFGVQVENLPNIDLFDDMDSFLALIDACDIIVTTSNSTAHFAGAAGKETLLVLPYSAGKFWYWHESGGQSLWYPSVKIFKQQEQGNWTQPINEIRDYLEKRFAV